MSTPTPDLIFDAKAQLGEGAIWDSRHNVLLWIDILGKKFTDTPNNVAALEPIHTPERLPDWRPECVDNPRLGPYAPFNLPPQF